MLVPRFHKARLILICVLLCLFIVVGIDGSVSSAPTVPESNTIAANLHRWGAVTLFHGLPSDRVRAIAQSKDGTMWFGTDAGLARYDGRRIQTISIEGVPARRILALRVDELGAMWVGTEGGAAVLLPSGQFRPLAELTGKSVPSIATPERGRTILVTQDGAIFECLTDEHGLLRVSTLSEPGPRENVTQQGGSPSRRDGAPLREVEPSQQPLEITSVSIGNGRVLVGTRGRGLQILENGSLQELITRPRPFFIETLTTRNGQETLFGAQSSGVDSGLFRINATSGKSPTKLAGATGTVTAISFGKGNDIFAGTESRGVFHYRDDRMVERFTFAGTAGGLRSDKIYAVFVDREGVAWFGTDRGVCRYDPKGVSVEALTEENEGNFVRSVYRTRAGRLLAGTNRGLYVRDMQSATWRSIEEIEGKTVFAISEDPSGMLLVGTGVGLFTGLQTDPKEPAKSEPLEEAPDTTATPVAPATTEGSAPSASPEPQPSSSPADESKTEETPSEPQTKKTPEPALRGSIRAIAVFEGATYVASYGRGLERYESAGRRTLIWPKTNEDPLGRDTVSLYVDESNRRLWIGTANAGAFYFDGKAVRTDPVLAGLRTSTVWSISSEGDWTWFATGRGLFARRDGDQLLEIASGVDARSVVVSPKANSQTSSPQAWCATAGGGVLKAAVDDEFGPLTARLDAEQGLPSQSAFVVFPLPGNEGEPALLVGTTRGLARYEPGLESPALSLTRVTASRTHQPEELRDRVLTLEYPQSGLVLDVAANASRTFPEQFQYAFLLTDTHGSVIKKRVSHDSQFQAESLPAGKYRVIARAYTVDLVPSSPLAFEFEVARAPFPWTIVSLSILLALAMVALVFGYVQHRKIVRSGEELLEANRQLGAARLQLANEAESERRRIARDLHDQTLADLRRLLLLTDEMQNDEISLNGDNSASGVDPSELRSEIESISHEVRRICEDLSPSVLENVGFAAALEWALASALAHLPADCKFTYDFLCDENLEERVRLAPGVQMQIYRIVQEAVSNICRHAAARNVKLSLHATEEGDFLLRLEDDGRGFNHTQKREKTGRGLGGIRARASLIEADVEWEARPGGGTILILRKPGAALQLDVR